MHGTAPSHAARPDAATPDPAPIWTVRPPAPPAAVERTMRTLNVPPLLAATLWSRGFREADDLAQLDPPLRPSPIPTLDAAAERLATALERGERILVHGDYDADGITGSAVLLLGLRALGGRVEAFLPNRLTHGYGVHADLVPQHAARAELFVTVDCGIANLAEVDALRAAGTDVIVTDHHTPGERLPDALIVHPRLAPDGVTMRPAAHQVEPTGSGVAYHLLWRLHRRLGLEDPATLLDVATIGTIADVAPLLGENRALVRAGLERLAESAWPGVRAMVAQSRVRGTPTARDVAFALAPRLNAAGRLGEPEKGLALLIAGSERSARELAVYLDARNDERRRIQDAMFDEAVTRVDPGAPAIVVGDDAWHPGVMGIVASKLLERFHRPVFIMARGQGSVRSTPGISAVEALRDARNELLRFGGHAAAAGFAIAPERVDAFRERVHAFVARHEIPRPTVEIDALLDPSQVDEDLWRGVVSLEPFGEGHVAPRFALADVLQAARAVGKDGRHLQLRVRDVKGVAWNLGERAATLRPGRAVQAAVALQENVWNERRTIEFLADDVRPARPLGVAPDAGVPALAARVRRGRLPDPQAGRQLLDLPLHPDPLRAHEGLSELLASDAPLWIDLDADAQAELWRAARRYPTVHDVRAAWWARSRGVRPRLGPAAAEAAGVILEELGLIDDEGRPLRGARREPYASPTLRAGLLQRYRIETFLNAYRHLDDDGFAITTATLFTPGDA
jgi:single-stranded-DNA-specific exonuclease